MKLTDRIYNLFESELPNVDNIGVVTTAHLKTLVRNTSNVFYDHLKQIELSTKDGWVITINMKNQSIMLHSKKDNEWYNDSKEVSKKEITALLELVPSKIKGELKAEKTMFNKPVYAWDTGNWDKFYKTTPAELAIGLATYDIQSDYTEESHMNSDNSILISNSYEFFNDKQKMLYDYLKASTEDLEDDSSLNRMRKGLKSKTYSKLLQMLKVYVSEPEEDDDKDTFTEVKRIIKKFESPKFEKLTRRDMY